MAVELRAPASEPVGFFSALAMREVIAGCRLEIGDEKARTARCTKRVEALTARVVELTDIAHRLNTWNLWGPILAGLGGILLGGLVGVLGAAFVRLPAAAK